MYNDDNKRLDLIILKLEEMLRGEFAHKLDHSDLKNKDRITTVTILINALSENWGRAYPSMKTMPYEPAFDFISILTFVIEPQGGIFDVNQTTCTALGRTKTDMVGKSFMEFLSKGSQKKWHKILKEIQAGKKPSKSDVYLDFLLDSNLVISTCGTLYMPKDSKLIQVNGVCHSLYSSIENLNINEKEVGSLLNKEFDLYVTMLYNHIKNNPKLDFTEKMILAKDIGIKLFKLRNAFKQKYVFTVQNFLLKQRLKYARTKLLKSKKTIYNVALESGFKNVSHFYVTFKAEFNMTPRQLRKMGEP